MRAALNDPSWLLILVPGIPLALLGFRWFATMALARRVSAVTLRVLLIALLATLLAGASSVRSTNRLAVIALVDVSQSVRLFADAGLDAQSRPRDPIDAVRAYLATACADRGPEDLLGIVAFDSRAIAIAAPTTADLSARTLEIPPTQGTDLAGAIRDGASLVPPDAAARFILFSDGNQTQGDALAAARQVTDSSVRARRATPIDVVPLTLRADHEVIVESLDAPPRAAAQATINLRVTLRATAPATGTLRILLNDQPATGVPPRRVEIPTGRTVEIIPVPLPVGRVHNFRAIYEPDTQTLPDGSVRVLADTRAENNTADAFTLTPGRGSILLVDPTPGAPDSQTLARALRESNLNVSIVTPSAIPPTSVDLQAYDLLILNNVPAELVPEPAQHAIESSVKDLGLGLVMVGGPDSFGAGGWKGTPIEPLLPVKLDLPERLVQPDAAVILVIDNSGSMGRGVLGTASTQQEIANQSAALAIRSLDKKDLVGVIVFNNDYDVLIPLAPNSDPAASGRRVLSISAGGGTVALPALQEARRQLKDAKASVKHLILLSDGVSQNREALPDLARAMWKDDKIIVSAIGIGNEMDEQTMAALAAEGGGKFYPVTNAQLLPRFLLKAVRIVRSPLIRTGLFTPIVTPSGSPLTLGLAPLPPPALNGIVLTQARPEPTITYAMLHPQGEPLLAHWVCQLGQVAAFTSDVGPWASAWVDWPGFRQLWSSIARTIARPQTPGRFELTSSSDASRATLRLEAAGDDARPLDGLSVPATLYPIDAPDRPISLSLSQTAPGVYEGTTPALAPGNYIATITPRAGDQRLSPVVGGVAIAAGAELRDLTTNTALLRQIAASTGGRVLDLNDPRSARLFDRAGLEPTLARTPLFRPLLVLTLIVLMLDIATRRIAWDRLVSPEFGSTLRERAIAAIEDRGPAASRTATRLRQSTPVVRTAPAESSLSDADAQRIIEEQRLRRAQARLDAARAMREAELEARAADAIPDPPAAPPTEDPATGLLAAKRRAQQRLSEGQPPQGDR